MDLTQAALIFAVAVTSTGLTTLGVMTYFLRRSDPALKRHRP